ncbi:MAG TPA: winged helix-turn-helix domain-containing protein [Solirubrobacterales bacterium]|nr:winged helix-turn-helix domain-containing protein [Solirubrobacterales bacterium]
MAGKSMRDLREGDELKTFIDRRLIKALGHPVREHIFAVLNERIASAREIGEEIGADVSAFYHHIELLEELGCIERVESRQRRGATEHFFRAKQTLFFDDEAWKGLPESFKDDFAVSSLQYLFDDVVRAIESGTLNARDDRHATWMPISLDDQGWKEVMAVMDRALIQVGSIHKAASLRLARGAAPQINTTVSLLAFETPGGEQPTPNGQARETEQISRPTSPPSAGR